MRPVIQLIDFVRHIFDYKGFERNFDGYDLYVDMNRVTKIDEKSNILGTETIIHRVPWKEFFGEKFSYYMGTYGGLSVEKLKIDMNCNEDDYYFTLKLYLGNSQTIKNTDFDKYMTVNTDTVKLKNMLRDLYKVYNSDVIKDNELQDSIKCTIDDMESVIKEKLFNQYINDI